MKTSFRKKAIQVVVLVVVSMLISFCTSMYTVQSETQWQSDSEKLVWGRVANAVRNGLAADGGFLGAFPKQMEMTLENAINESSPGEFSLYTRQSGLQGTLCAIFVIAAKNAGIGVYHAQRMLWIITSGLLIFTIILFAKWLNIEMGRYAAIGALTCLIFAPWMQRSMANTYWVMWTMMVPFLVTAYWGDYVKKGVALPKGLPEMILFLAMLLRFFCGYEFTTTIMLASEVPIVYYFMKEKSSRERKKWFWIAFRIGVLELAAFAVSFVVLGIQSMLYFKTDFISATTMVIEAAKFRTGTFTNAADVAVYTEDAYNITNVLNANGWSVLKTYLLSDVKIWGTFDFKKLTFLTVAAIVVKGFIAKSEKKQTAIELLLLILAAIPAMSWYYIGYGHAIFHEHVDYVLWDIPFLPICMALLFYALSEIYKSCIKENGKNCNL